MKTKNCGLSPVQFVSAKKAYRSCDYQTREDDEYEYFMEDFDAEVFTEEEVSNVQAFDNLSLDHENSFDEPINYNNNMMQTIREEFAGNVAGNHHISTTSNDTDNLSILKILNENQDDVSKLQAVASCMKLIPKFEYECKSSGSSSV